MNRDQFLKKLNELAEEGRKAQGVLSEERINEFISECGLGEDETLLLKEFLKEKNINLTETDSFFDYLSEDEKTYINDYFEQLEGLKKYTDGELQAIKINVLAGDSSAKKAFLETMLSTVVDIARLYVNEGVMIEDLIGEGNLALTFSLEDISEVEKPEDLEPYLAKNIMEAMEMLIDENEEEKKKDKKIEDRVNKIADKAKEMSEDLRMDVSIDELANETGISKKAIRDAIVLSGYKIEGIVPIEEE